MNLWHVAPEFNGDIRRHARRCYAHTGSQKKYDAHMAQLVERWLALHTPQMPCSISCAMISLSCSANMV